MRTKNFLIVLCVIIMTSLILIIFGSAGQQNDSLKTIVSQTHQQLRDIQQNFRTTTGKLLEVDQKYLDIIGFGQFTQTTVAAHNASAMHHRANFSIVTYLLSGQTPAGILLAQNVALKLPNSILLIYDVGLSEDDLRTLMPFCNNTKCTVIQYDLKMFPSHLTNDRQIRAYRPLIIKDALNHSKSILFIENNKRIRSNVNEQMLQHVLTIAQNGVGILGWTTQQAAVSSRTHPKMFDYFATDKDCFQFLPMVSMETVFFVDTLLINDKILLPWIKCALTLECIYPIGAQSEGCKFNKKPLYRYSGCHDYDESAFNIVLGLTWEFNETKYSIHGESNLFYTETLGQATKLLENKRKNISSDTSDHPFTDD